MTSEEESEGRGWHLERHIPVGLVLIVVGGIVAGAMWAASVTYSLEIGAEDIAKLSRTEIKMEDVLEKIEGEQRLILYRLDQLEKVDRK